MAVRAVAQVANERHDETVAALREDALREQLELAEGAEFLHSAHVRAHGEQLIELERHEASERATLEEQAQAIHDAMIVGLTQRAADAVAEVGMRAASELHSQAEAADQRLRHR